MDESLLTAFAAVERSHWWFQARREIILAVVERAVPSGGAVLDIGCGTGFVLERLRERYDAWGLDVSATAVALCRARGLEQVALGSAGDPSAVRGRRFQAVLFLDVLEHLDDDAGSLRLARELLLPGGAVIVTVPAFMFLWSHHDDLNQHRRRYDRPGVEALLHRGGFRIEQVSYFNAYLFPVAAAARTAARVLGSSGSGGLRVPPRPINALLRRVFESEKGRLARQPPGRGFPFGISLLAVGRVES